MQYIQRGQTTRVNLKAVNGSGGTTDLTSKQIDFSMKLDSIDGSEVVSKSTTGTDEIIITNAVNGLFSINLLNTDTKPLDGTYFYYSVEVDESTIIQDYLIVAQGSTGVIPDEEGYNYLTGISLEGVVDGVNTIFTYGGDIQTNTQTLYVENVYQKPDIDYTISGSTFTLDQPPYTGMIVQFSGWVK